MTASWIVWAFSALVLFGAISFLKHMPGAKDFRTVAAGLGILALAATAARPEWQWHLLWIIPFVIVAAYIYALRRLFALSHRVNQLTKSGASDPEQFRRALQGEVDEHNRVVPEDQRLR